MVLLRSLQISGIRNFSPDDHQIVDFNTPVVIFQGANGSGKTTILECIRYALTGKKPEIGGGRGFVSEPKMSNTDSTKGNITIICEDVQGNTLTIERDVKVRLNNEGKHFFNLVKYLGSKRPKDDPNNPEQMSLRCSTSYSFCRTFLKVPKSIFDNVLFCHQENSLWPLDEPNQLKEKFDQIFDLGRYSKCLDDFENQIRRKKSEIKKMEYDLNDKKKKMQEVKDIRAKFVEKKCELKQIKESITEKENELEALEQRIRELLETENSLGSLQTQLSQKQGEIKGFETLQTALEKDISDIFEGTSEELQLKIKSFDDEVLSETTVISQLETKIPSINEQIRSSNCGIESKQRQIGQMEREQNQYNTNVAEFSDKIDNLRRKLDVGYIEDAESLLGELTSALRALESKLKDEEDAEENELQSRINNLIKTKAKTEQNIDSKSSSIEEYENKKKDIQNKLKGLDSSNTQLENGDDIKTLETELSQLKHSFNENDKQQEIRELKDTIDREDRYLKELDIENKILQKNYTTEQNIERERNSIVEKQVKINQIKAQHSQDLRTLFNEAVPEKDLKNAVSNIQSIRERELKAYTKLIHDSEKQLTNWEADLRILKDQLKTCQRDLLTNEQRVSDLCRGKDFNVTLDKTFEKKEELQKKKGHLTASKIMYEKFINEFEKKSCCPVCKTDFTDNMSSIQNIIRELKENIKQLPDLAGIEEDLKEEEIFYNKLQQLKPMNDHIQNLSNSEIPELKRKINELEEQIRKESSKFEDLKSKQEEAGQAIEMCNTVITDATLFDQYQSDITQANVNIQEMGKIIERVPSNRSRSEIEEEIDKVNAQHSNTKERHEASKIMLDTHRDKCQDINKRIQTALQRQIYIQEKSQLEIQNTKYNDTLLVLRADVEELKLSVSSQEEELKEAIDNKAKATKANSEKEITRNDLIVHSNSLSDIRKLLESIREYERNKNDEKLNKAEEELVELKDCLENLEKKKTNIVNSVSKRKETLAKRQSEFGALKDNESRLRQIKSKKEEMAAEVEEIKKNTEANKKQIFEEKQRKSDELTKKNSEIDILTGRRQEKQLQTNELREKLNLPDNKNADESYRKVNWQLSVENRMLKHLLTYARALESSLLKLFEARMVEINHSIRNLWTDIYKGNDIDCIKIKSDFTSVGNKISCNYKVVQIKNGVEFDMRGRCSAGQKVLACLVIRMALAEIFSSDCAILALDEPTTNLDKENILSLSDTLSSLIDSRKDQSNFQLLIVSHNKEFIQSLTQKQSLDSYWEVKRNARGDSVVNKVPL